MHPQPPTSLSTSLGGQHLLLPSGEQCFQRQKIPCEASRSICDEWEYNDGDDGGDSSLHSESQRKAFQSLVSILTDQPIGNHVMPDIKPNHTKLAQLCNV